MNDSGAFLLPADVRSVIEADRHAPEPPADARDEVARRLEADLGLGTFSLGMAIAASIAPPPLVNPPPPTIAPVPSVLGWKIAAMTSLAVTVGMGVVPVLHYFEEGPVGATGGARTAATRALALPTESPAPRPSVEPPSAAPYVPAAPILRTGGLMGESARSAISSRTADSPRPAAAPRVSEPSRIAEPARPAERPRTAEAAPQVGDGATRNDRLRQERAVLDGALRALAMRDATGALEAIRSHEQLFGGGQLGQERESMRVQALVLSHDCGSARAAAARFHRAYPHSVFGLAIDKALGSCGG